MTTDDDNADGCISENYYGDERGGTRHRNRTARIGGSHALRHG